MKHEPCDFGVLSAVLNICTRHKHILLHFLSAPLLLSRSLSFAISLGMRGSLLSYPNITNTQFEETLSENLRGGSEIVYTPNRQILLRYFARERYVMLITWIHHTRYTYANIYTYT